MDNLEDIKKTSENATNASNISNASIKIVFMGTPEFAVPSLAALIDNGYDVVAVVTQPDKPKGRHGSQLTPPPVKVLAQAHGIAVLQPEKARDAEFIESIAELKPDMFVTAAYGQILKPALLDIPTMGCINVHGSLLPAYRGAAPIQWAVINGDAETGITTMFTDAGIDTGDILLKCTTTIDPDETAGMLHDRLSILGAQLLIDTLKGIQNGSVKRVPQQHSEATYASMLKKEMAQISFERRGFEIHNLVRGMNPWPIAYTFMQGMRVKVHATSRTLKEELHFNDGGKLPGTVLDVNAEGIVVKCGEGWIVLKELQPESGKRMDAKAFAAGYRIKVGDVFGGAVE